MRFSGLIVRAAKMVFVAGLASVFPEPKLLYGGSIKPGLCFYSVDVWVFSWHRNGGLHVFPGIAPREVGRIFVRHEDHENPYSPSTRERFRDLPT